MDGVAGANALCIGGRARVAARVRSGNAPDHQALIDDDHAGRGVLANRSALIDRTATPEKQSVRLTVMYAHRIAQKVQHFPSH